MFDFWNEDLTAEQEHQLLAKAARTIEKRRMTAVAILALEMHKPLAHVGASAAVVFAPFIVPILGYEMVHDYTRLFRKRENVERLIRMLERPREEILAEEVAA